MFLRASLVGLVLSCFALLESGPASAPVRGAVLEAEGKAEFDAALQQVQQSMQSHRFKEAKELLLSKLDEHKDKEYVRAHLDEVRADLKSCSFGIQHPRKQPADLFCGAVTWDAKTGQISLVWRKDAKGKDGKAATKFPCDDFATLKSERVLKLPFEGPFTLQLSGKAMGQTAPKVRLCIQDETWYEAVIDAGDASTLVKVEEDLRTNVAFSTTSGMNVNRPYVLKYTVRDAQIEASCNGTRVLLGDKAKAAFGQLAFRDVADLEKIEVTGKAKAAWIEEQIEALSKKELAEFEKTYDAKADLPAWLQ